MASKKGIIITAAIAAAIIGASSIVWLVPQTNAGIFSNPRSPQDLFSNIYSQSNDLATSVNSTYQRWQQGKIDSQVMLNNISQAQQSSNDMKNQLVSSNPPSEYQKSFSLYEGALDSFNAYLSKLKNDVGSNSSNSTAKTTSPDITNAWSDWQRQVDESVGALPVGS